MIFIKKLFLILFFFFISLNIAYSNEKVFFIDLDLIIKNSIYGKKFLIILIKLMMKNISQLEKKKMSYVL